VRDVSVVLRYDAFGHPDIAAFIYERVQEADLPILSVTIGRLNNRRTWRVELTPTATPQQQVQADALMSDVPEYFA
jgi:hypothetical protein